MLKSFVKTIVLFAGLAWAGLACAVGFGNATLHSALGQPLKVEIALTEVAPKDEGGMTASLASADAFKAAGLDYPYNLTTLKFRIIDRDGRVFVEVTSKLPVNDSYVNLLVQLDWPSGRLLREYTLLLDPPDYHASQPLTEVEPIEPMVAAAPPAEPPTVTPIQQGTPAEASAPEATSGAEVPVPMQPGSAPEATEEASAPEAATPAEASAPEAATPSEASAPEAAPPAEAKAPEAAPSEAPAETPPPEPEPKTIKVKHGDTLTRIAQRVQEPDLTLDQMLVALYRANASKFGGKNMNRLRAGTILTMPQAKDYEHLTQREAVRVIHVQAKNWNAYRQRLAAASAPAVVESQPRQETTGKVSTAVEDRTPVTQQSSKEVLKLSAGEKPGDKIAPVGKQAQANANQENQIARQKQAQDEQMRIAKQEELIRQQKLAITMQGGTPASGAKTASPLAPASGVKPALGAKPKTPPPAPPAPPKSMVDTVLDTAKGILSSLPVDPMYIGIGVGGLLLVGVGATAWRRRNSGGPAKKKKVKIKPKT